MYKTYTTKDFENLHQRYSRDANPPNELTPVMLGVNATNPYVAVDSSARAQMTGSHLSQAPVLISPSTRWVQTGVEMEHARYAYNVVAPCSMAVLKVIPFYQRAADDSSIDYNPATYVIYQDMTSHEIGVLELPQYHNYGGKFGFKYEHGPSYVKALTVGSRLQKDEIILRAPCVSDTGDLMTGVQLNVAFMTHYCTAEDSIVVSETAAKEKLLTRTLHTVTVSCDDNRVPRLIYNKNGKRQAFPDIGDFVRDDGLLMSIMDPDRDSDLEIDLMAPAERSMKALQEPDLIFDDPYFVQPGGRIVDLRVYHQGRFKDMCDLDDQAIKYHAAAKKFADQMIDYHRSLKKTYGSEPILKPEYSNLLTRCLTLSPPDATVKRAQLVHKQEVLGKWRIEFTIEYVRKVTIGSKATDLHAGKGVACKIWPDEWMPVDSEGNRADVIMDPNGHINRMNPGRAFEQYQCAAISKANRDVKNILGLHGTYSENAARIKLQNIDPSRVEQAFQHVMGLHGKFNQQIYDAMARGEIGSDRIAFLAPTVANGIHVFCPTDNPKNHVDIVLDIENSIYRPPFGPLVYRGHEGNMVTTKGKIRIGSCYIILLSKLGDEWSATSSGARQAHGVPAAVTNTTKYRLPWRSQPTRAFGESEGRAVSGNCGGEVLATIFHGSCSTTEAAYIAQAIMKADKPTNIDKIVDRDKIPYGTSRPLMIINHLLACAGVRFKHKRTSPVKQR